MLTLNGVPTQDFVGDISVSGDITGGTDIMYPSKCIIKTIGIAGSGTDFAFDADANSNEQNENLGALIPAGAELVSVVLECDETVSDGGDQSMGIDVGITTGTDAILSTANTDSDGDTNTTTAAGSPVLAHSTAARNVWVNATPGVNWSTLTGGQWSLILVYNDLGAVRTQKGL